MGGFLFWLVLFCGVAAGSGSPGTCCSTVGAGLCMERKSAAVGKGFASPSLALGFAAASVPACHTGVLMCVCGEKGHDLGRLVFV